MNETRIHDHKGPKLNVNSYISLGLLVVLLGGGWTLLKTLSGIGEDVMRKSEERFAQKDTVDARFTAVNQLLDARVTILTDRMVALTGSLADLRVTAAALPDLSAGVRDIQKRLDRMETQRTK